MKKPGHSYKRNPIQEDYDVIVIGSGMGGLTAAAFLAKTAGKRVLVLERHYVAGGFTHSFERPGFDWDVGVHYIGDVLDPKSDTRRVFDFVTDGAVEWASMGDVYDRVFIGEQAYDLVQGRDRFVDTLSDYFPGHRDEILNYMQAVRECLSTSQRYFIDKAIPPIASKLAGWWLRRPFLKWSNCTTAEVLDGITDNPTLKAVLTGQYGDYGLPPTQSSFAIHAMVANHYFEGGAYPVGGSSVIPAAAEQVIEARGGKILINAEVDEILVRDDRAVGVRLVDGIEVKAKTVISDAGALNTFGKLLPSEIGNPVLSKLRQDVQPSVAHLCLYMGLDVPGDQLDLPTCNYWLYPDADHDKNFMRFKNDPEAPFPVVYLSFPSQKDPDFENRHPGKSTIDVITMANAEWFADWRGTRWKKRGEAYDALKSKFRERLLETVYQHFPKCRDHVEIAELSTPLTTQHFCNYDNGEIYGLDHTPGRFANRTLRPHTPVKGLYLTGQDVCSAGVAGAMFGGAMCASAIAGKNLLAAATAK